jgi:hypothetical protein
VEDAGTFDGERDGRQRGFGEGVWSHAFHYREDGGGTAGCRLGGNLPIGLYFVQNVLFAPGDNFITHRRFSARVK